MFDDNYGMFQAYANSKLALLMFAEELQHRLDKEKSSVIINSANPGTGRTLVFFVSCHTKKSITLGYTLPLGHNI